MKITDKIYGEVKVDGVLEELIQSKPMQRLKGIHQGGASYLVNKKWNVTRFDHSIGVMVLIKKMGGSIEEQIAGLLHDVSHTAFSHVIDYVFANQDEDYHEAIYRSVVSESEIPAILKKYHYHYEDLLFDDSQWTLLEQPAPDLCADRVDYTLRDMYEYGGIPLKEIHTFLDGLRFWKGRMYLQDLKAAEWFVRTYYKEVIDFFMDPLNVYANAALAETLRLALDKNIIDITDFLGEDAQVISQLKEAENQEVKERLCRIHEKVNVKADGVNYDLHHKSKVRLIDPMVMDGQDLKRASVLSDKVKEMNELAYQKSKKGVYVNILADK
ncbi:hypothetical protein SAMN05192559_101871 [Halobacillus karajensis]|uniref:Phosphoribosylaminoimidazolesuccinocarboxamide (SAICAR) synthase n=1 Tax=Halobacillus karajensis TaxID=195088 RepID=A0A059NYT2_9BACI|nr:HD domain-containing protein [Halobacillus karajensis]CDQ18517.1 Phosphoribosylaminoimidazolesuccinocarboxamide (SAICAR) synthase [Halobacillus karajensis]CDQ23411.1 Phosphoribosylaminoimidazolesuccinocarboxamide (SAICAR) synthase [Halobacillus karajensis]CDQ26893.1 Phosphoribosylaminoimidazolesuccinocarboxamide (SAICAR) synthase [Halobacillus karajensis]SEH50484.1 hypothetical protein SAMN05192559_101871 [Halobacillus karajensis]